MTGQLAREDGYPGSTTGSSVNNTDNKLVAPECVPCSGLSGAPGCLVCAHLMQASLFMQDAGDSVKSEDEDEVVQPPRLTGTAESPLGAELLHTNHLHSATAASVSVCPI